ncbi:GNAT family N-acetyltransferase [Flavobacterium lotistagni]|uniref:GNAT family N-acetyltransferase n=1 Tax=Flavobacterium lotistagni TaxID=2709660 RepID=UPI001A9C9A34|nr:GNAT family N-acetyltransferase [Flavobacterium lotistagni]
MEIKELTSIEEMLEQLQLLQFLYPELTHEKYKSYLEQMLPHRYTQIVVSRGKQRIGLTGCWSGTKLWTGPYLEIDNFIVHPEHRRKGVGKMLTDYVQQKALHSGCVAIVLDAFTQNFKAHRFYYNEGFSPKGFHFVKVLDKERLT